VGRADALCVSARTEVKPMLPYNFNGMNHLTTSLPHRRIIRSDRECTFVGHTSSGGDTVSTGVKTRGMHAERHRLVNPVEHNVTADTQLALAA
jgi:hypothetical protein